MISNRKLSLGGDWIYKQNQSSSGVPVSLPHTNRELPLQYFDEEDFQFVSTYQRALPKTDPAKRVFITFDGVMTAFSLRVNGSPVGEEQRGGYLPHTVDLTGHLAGEDNSLEVTVDSREREDIPPFGYAIDYLTFGGIYRDVWLHETDSCYIENCFFSYELTAILGDADTGTALCTPEIVLDNAGAPAPATITLAVFGTEQTAALTAESGKKSYTLPTFELSGVKLWDTEHPALYEVSLSLLGPGFSDSATLSVGFRDISLTRRGALLNNRPIKLIGLNRHQSFPYVGYAMPKRAQERDAKILKTELGLNLVRSSHYPPSPWFLDECDRQGLLVMEEIPGWQHISQREDWRCQCLADVSGMVTRDFNHPSVITWGVRINESQDDDELYTKTNDLARRLDPSRATSGIRCIERSHLLEDVYTMNDFIHDGGTNILRTQERCTGLSRKVPYIITEFCGHTFPTKRFDQEERLIEHALRHGRVQSLASQREDTIGAVGWCAFDYNTHYDFGSGDRICYHGVMDAFRIPKFAAAVYKSQRPTSAGYVLEPLTYWARGERDNASISPIYVFTNCQKIQVKIGEHTTTYERQFYNTHQQMQYLKNPPIVVEIDCGEWGQHLPELEITGLLDGTDSPVISRRFARNPVYTKITAEADDSAIFCGEQDATRVVIKAIDQAGNPLPYLCESFQLSAGPDLEIIGPSLLSVCGGMAAFWVRTAIGAQPGTQSITVTAGAGHTATVHIELKAHLREER